MSDARRPARRPTNPEYAEAVQDPSTALADPDLAGGVLDDIDRHGMLRTSSGRGAVVLRLTGSPARRTTRPPRGALHDTRTR